MKINALTVAGALTVILALAVLTSHRPSWGQPGDVFVGGSPVAQATPDSTPPGRMASVTGRQAVGGQSEAWVRALLQKLRQAEDDEAREKITAEARDLFAQYFDADLEARQKQVDELKDRIAKLEAQIERRREAKEEIIDLQLKVIRNEAEGLGFYSELSGFSSQLGADPFAPRAVARPASNPFSLGDGARP